MAWAVLRNFPLAELTIDRPRSGSEAAPSTTLGVGQVLLIAHIQIKERRAVQFDDPSGQRFHKLHIMACKDCLLYTSDAADE